jgi:hypothetical protein
MELGVFPKPIFASLPAATQNRIGLPEERAKERLCCDHGIYPQSREAVNLQA